MKGEYKGKRAHGAGGSTGKGYNAGRNMGEGTQNKGRTGKGSRKGCTVQEGMQGKGYVVLGGAWERGRSTQRRWELWGKVWRGSMGEGMCKAREALGKGAGKGSMEWQGVLLHLQLHPDLGWRPEQEPPLLPGPAGCSMPLEEAEAEQLQR